MTRRHDRRRGRRGMSLVEVIVAIGILLVMSAMIFRALHSSIEFHNLLADRDVTTRTARAALAKITRDIQLAFLTPNRQAMGSYQTVFVGLDEEPAKLFFTSLNHQRLYLNSRECDQTEITIWGEPSPAERGHGYVLYHREAPRVDEEPDVGGRVWPLAYNVRSFSVRYLEQVSGEWRTEWDTRGADTPYRLPRAVEIGLVLIAPDPEDLTGERTIDVPFLSRVVLEYAERLPNPNDAFNQAMAGTAPGGVPGMPQLPGGLGGLGGMGLGGLSGGGQVGGMLGMMGGQQQSRPGRGSGGRPARPPAGGASGGMPGMGGPPGLGGMGGRP